MSNVHWVFWASLHLPTSKPNSCAIHMLCRIIDTVRTPELYTYCGCYLFRVPYNVVLQNRLGQEECHVFKLSHDTRYPVEARLNHAQMVLRVVLSDN